jgi:hypothetical protein
MKAVVRDLGRVVEDAVERNSWGKSRSEGMCCFPNTGGLHCTSGDAPLDTQNISLDNGTIGAQNGQTKTQTCKIYDEHRTINPIIGGTTPTSNPSWCHVNKSNTPSSKRTQVAARAFKEKSHDSASQMTKHKRHNNSDQKRFKQVRFFKDVKACNVALSISVKMLTTDEIRRHIVVCDGGDTINNAIQPESSSTILRIRDGDLWIADTVNATLGLRFIMPGETTPVFLRLPRIDALGIMNNGRRICSAMRSCASTQRQ